MLDDWELQRDNHHHVIERVLVCVLACVCATFVCVVLLTPRAIDRQPEAFVFSSIPHDPLLKYVLHSTPSIKPICVDGSPAVFYFRPSSVRDARDQNLRWVIHLGGSHQFPHSTFTVDSKDLELGIAPNASNDRLPNVFTCHNVASCFENRHLTSSREYPERMFHRGLLSQDTTENPEFFDANHVFVPYCSGDLWIGRSIPHDMQQSFAEARVTFHGQDILDGVFQNLLPHGLENAREILLSGSNEGGVGLVNNLARLQTALPKSAHVVALNDGGLVFDHVLFNVPKIFKGFPVWGTPSCPGSNAENLEKIERLFELLGVVDEREKFRSRGFGYYDCSMLDIEASVEFVGDGYCDVEFNTPLCLDGGDCCQSSCVDESRDPSRCGSGGFFCVDSRFIKPQAMAEAKYNLWIRQRNSPEAYDCYRGWASAENLPFPLFVSLSLFSHFQLASMNLPEYSFSHTFATLIASPPMHPSLSHREHMREFMQAARIELSRFARRHLVVKGLIDKHSRMNQTTQGSNSRTMQESSGKSEGVMLSHIWRHPIPEPSATLAVWSPVCRDAQGVLSPLAFQDTGQDHVDGISFRELFGTFYFSWPMLLPTANHNDSNSPYLCFAKPLTDDRLFEKRNWRTYESGKWQPPKEPCDLLENGSHQAGSHQVMLFVEQLSNCSRCVVDYSVEALQKKIDQARISWEYKQKYQKQKYLQQKIDLANQPTQQLTPTPRANKRKNKNVKMPRQYERMFDESNRTPKVAADISNSANNVTPSQILKFENITSGSAHTNEKFQKHLQDIREASSNGSMVEFFKRFKKDVQTTNTTSAQNTTLGAVQSANITTNSTFSIAVHQNLTDLRENSTLLSRTIGTGSDVREGNKPAFDDFRHFLAYRSNSASPSPLANPEVAEEFEDDDLEPAVRESNILESLSNLLFAKPKLTPGGNKVVRAGEWRDVCIENPSRIPFSLSNLLLIITNQKPNSQRNENAQLRPGIDATVFKLEASSDVTTHDVSNAVLTTSSVCASFNISVAGSYNLDVLVKVNATHQRSIGGSPMQVTVLPGVFDATQSIVKGIRPFEFFDPSLRAKQFQLEILGRDRFGNEITQGGDSIYVRYVGPVIVLPTVSDHRDGSYHVKVALPEPGVYTVEIVLLRAQLNPSLSHAHPKTHLDLSRIHGTHIHSTPSTTALVLSPAEVEIPASSFDNSKELMEYRQLRAEHNLDTVKCEAKIQNGRKSLGEGYWMKREIVSLLFGEEYSAANVSHLGEYRWVHHGCALELIDPLTCEKCLESKWIHLIGDGVPRDLYRLIKAMLVTSKELRSPSSNLRKQLQQSENYFREKLKQFSQIEGFEGEEYPRQQMKSGSLWIYRYEGFGNASVSWAPFRDSVQIRNTDSDAFPQLAALENHPDVVAVYLSSEKVCELPTTEYFDYITSLITHVTSTYRHRIIWLLPAAVHDAVYFERFQFCSFEKVKERARMLREALGTQHEFIDLWSITAPRADSTSNGYGYVWVVNPAPSVGSKKFDSGMLGFRGPVGWAMANVLLNHACSGTLTNIRLGSTHPKYPSPVHEIDPVLSMLAFAAFVLLLLLMALRSETFRSFLYHRWKASRGHEL